MSQVKPRHPRGYPAPPPRRPGLTGITGRSRHTASRGRACLSRFTGQRGPDHPGLRGHRRRRRRAGRPDPCPGRHRPVDGRASSASWRTPRWTRAGHALVKRLPDARPASEELLFETSTGAREEESADPFPMGDMTAYRVRIDPHDPAAQDPWWGEVLSGCLANVGVPLPRRRARARELLEAVGLGRRPHSQPHQLSGGGRQRAALARALSRGARPDPRRRARRRPGRRQQHHDRGPTAVAGPAPRRGGGGGGGRGDPRPRSGRAGRPGGRTR